MQIAIDRIEAAARKISIDGGELWRSGPFEDLVAQLGFEISMSQAKHEPENLTMLDVLRQLRFIQQDVSNIETLCERLEWQRGFWNSGEIDNMKWGRFAAADIVMFHVEYRSIFDYVARILASLSDKPGQVASTKPGQDKVVSFESLSGMANQPKYTSKLGTDIVDHLKRCDWFGLLRGFRDLLAHFGGETFVFYDKPEIQFQIYHPAKQYDRKVMLPGIMCNENVARFDLYAGVFYGYLLWYLDETAPVIARRLGLNVIRDRSRSLHPGLAVMQSWMSKTIDSVLLAVNSDG